MAIEAKSTDVFNIACTERFLAHLCPHPYDFVASVQQPSVADPDEGPGGAGALLYF